MPKKIVMISPLIIPPQLPLIKEWWAQVKLIPDLTRITVFKRGMAKGDIGEILKGGQLIPLSMVGDNLK